jgi:hypothetical protein
MAPFASDAARERARRTRVMLGWDDAIAGRLANPYQREDYRRDYEHGHRMCLAGKPLPGWYQEWWIRRRRGEE